MPVSSQPPPKVPTNIVENEDLAWEHFGEALKDEGINVCYDMSLKDFEHSGVHDLFKVLTVLLHRLYYLIIIFFFFWVSNQHHSVHLFIGHVKIHRSVQASH